MASYPDELIYRRENLKCHDDYWLVADIKLMTPLHDISENINLNSNDYVVGMDRLWKPLVTGQTYDSVSHKNIFEKLLTPLLSKGIFLSLFHSYNFRLKFNLP